MAEESENNILDKLRSEHKDADYNKVCEAMKIFLDKILEGAKMVLKAAVNKGENNAILLMTMEDTEINGYPIKFLLGLESYENKSIESYGRTALAVVEDYMKKMDKRINTNLKKIEDYLIIEINWE